MPSGLPLRQWARQLIISGTTALRLDEVEHQRTQDEATRSIRVLFLHGTPDERAFRALLHWLQGRFEIVDFGTFDRLFRSATPPSRPAVLLTFDDGLVSNHRIAAPVLEDAGARGLFFVVPGFSLSPADAVHRFHAGRIRGARFEPPMTPGQIADLAGRGHTIGNHTFSHAWLSRTPPPAYGREIDDSAAILESWTGRAVDAFAWPFVWNGITPAAHRLAAARHRYCFSPCTGRNVPGVDEATLIWRTSIEPSSRVAEWRFQCSGLADRVAADRRRRLRHVLQADERAA